MQEKKKLPDEVLDQLAGGVGFGLNIPPAEPSGADPAAPPSNNELAGDLDRLKRSLADFAEGRKR